MLRWIILSVSICFILKADAQKSIAQYNQCDDLAAHMTALSQDKPLVVNFWATWCKPCVAELPYFLSLEETFKHQNLALLLVSLDFEHQVASRLQPFIQKHGITEEVVMLTDGDANDWINKVSSDWAGSIPATLVFYKGKSTFVEREFHTQKELDQYIRSLIQ